MDLLQQGFAPADGHLSEDAHALARMKGCTTPWPAAAR